MKNTESVRLETPELSAIDGLHAYGRVVKSPTRKVSRLPQGFFTPAEIATYMGMSTYHVQDLCRHGELRHVKVRRNIRIRKEWADKFMSERERAPLQ